MKNVLSLKSGIEKLSLTSINLRPTQAQAPIGTFIALHGWGANSQDLASLSIELELTNDFQCFFPDAPFPHPYAPGGLMWYDLESSDYPGLQESRANLQEWLLSLPGITGIPLEKTILAGFSQGGAMTLDVGSRLPLAGLIVLSGYLHAPLDLTNANLPPVLLIHGQADQVVPITAARRSRDVLLDLGAVVEYHELAMGHQIIPAVIDLMKKFLADRVSHFS